MTRTRTLLVVAMALLPGMVFPCEPSHSLEGVLSIPTCDSASTATECISGDRATRQALEALDIPGSFTIGVQSSPWRMYDAEGRIIRVEEVATAIRTARAESDKRVHLVGSWTAVRPDGSAETLAKKLSDALDGFPVDGTDGFLWLSPAGKMRITRQSFSVWKSGPYGVAPGEDVLMALVPGALAQFEDRFAEDGLAEGVVQAGIGHDVFMLCPDSALAAFERAAGMGSAIGAYNAGIMRGEESDHAAAIAWLEKAEALGEAKARATLATMREAGAR